MTVIDVFAELHTIDVAFGPPVTIDVAVDPVLLVDVDVDLPVPVGNRVVFGDFNYLFFGDQVIYGSN